MKFPGDNRGKVVYKEENDHAFLAYLYNSTCIILKIQDLLGLSVSDHLH